MKAFAKILFALGIILGAASCEKAEEAVDETSDAIEEGIDETGDAAREVGREIDQNI